MLERSASLLCRLSDLEATGARGITIELGGNRLREIVVVRDGDTGAIRAYVNACPHLGITLEGRPDRFLDETGRHLVCVMHGARFRTSDGMCVWGPCEGADLRAVAVRVADGAVWLDEPDPAV